MLEHLRRTRLAASRSHINKSRSSPNSLTIGTADRGIGSSPPAIITEENTLQRWRSVAPRDVQQAAHDAIADRARAGDGTFDC